MAETYFIWKVGSLHSFVWRTKHFCTISGSLTACKAATPAMPYYLQRHTPCNAAPSAIWQCHTAYNTALPAKSKPPGRTGLENGLTLGFGRSKQLSLNRFFDSSSHFMRKGSAREEWNGKNWLKQAQLGVPHSEIQVELLGVQKKTLKCLFVQYLWNQWKDF